MVPMATESVCIPFDIPMSHMEHSSSPPTKIRTLAGFLRHGGGARHHQELFSALGMIEISCVALCLSPLKVSHCYWPLFPLVFRGQTLVSVKAPETILLTNAV